MFFYHVRDTFFLFGAGLWGGCMSGRGVYTDYTDRVSLAELLADTTIKAKLRVLPLSAECFWQTTVINA